MEKWNLSGVLLINYKKKTETCYLIIMKIFFALVLFFISSSTYGEIIYCSYSFSNDSEEFLLERSKDKFNWTTEEKKQFTLDILWEDFENLILGENFTYGELPRYLTIWIEKETKKFRGTVLDKPSNDAVLSVEEGTCKFF